MGYFRFRRSIRIFPGVRWNIGKKSTSVSFGPRGLKYTIGTQGSRTTVGIPGTGMSYTQVHSSKPGSTTPPSTSASPPNPPPTTSAPLNPPNAKAVKDLLYARLNHAWHLVCQFSQISFLSKEQGRFQNHPLKTRRRRPLLLYRGESKLVDCSPSYTGRTNCTADCSPSDTSRTNCTVGVATNNAAGSHVSGRKRRAERLS